MANYDAEIRIGTKIDTSQMQKLQIQIDKATNKVETLSAKYDELNNKKISTEQYGELEIKLNNAKNVLDALIIEQKKFSDKGIGQGLDKEILKANAAVQKLKVELQEAISNKNQDLYLAVEDGLNRAKAKLQELMAINPRPLGDITSFGLNEVSIKKAEIEISNINSEMQKLVEKGKAFTIGGNSEEISKASKDLSIAKAELTALLTKQDELNASQSKTKLNLNSISDGFRKIQDVSKKLFASIAPKVQKTNGMLSTLASRFKGIALSLLIFNWVTRGFNAMVAGAKEGFNNLIKYSDTYNQSVTSLKNANMQLKNSFAAAFAPIVQMIIPHLISLINYVTTAMNSVAQFIAVLTGKSTWLKAIDIQGDYSDSLNGTAAAAKKAMGALASFDSLEVLNKKESGSGGGGNAGGGFEEIPIEPNAMVNLAKRLKELIAADDWYGVGVLIGEKINGLLENINWDYIQSKAGEIARNIANFLNGGLETINWNLVGYTLAQGLNTGLIFLNTFATTFHWESLGKAIYEGINGFISTFDFKLAAETISNISHGLFTTLDTAIAGVEWDELGVKVGEFFKDIRWNEIFSDVGVIVVDAFVAAIKFAGGTLLGNTELYEYFQTGMNEIVSQINARKGKFDTGDTTADGMALSKLESALDIYNEMYEAKEKTNSLSKTDIENGEKIYELLSKEGEITNLNLNDLEKYTEELVTSSKSTEGLFDKLKESLIGGLNSIDSWWKENAPLAFLPEWFEENVMPWFSAEKWSTLGQGILDGISLKWGELVEWWNQSAIGAWWEESVAPWFSSETWIELAQGIVDGISTKWEELSEWWSTNIVTWWDEYVAPWFTLEQWQKLGDNMKKGIYNGFVGIVSNVVGVINGIIAACENMINLLIAKINEMLTGAYALAKLAHLDIDFGTLAPIQFGRVTMPTIPALANGAVLRGGNPMLAILNDQPAGQTNIEAPLSTIEKALENVYNRVGNTNTAPANYFLQVNGQTFGELVVEDFISVLNRKGYNINVLLDN